MANEWTLMFFFAGDNTLSPSMISQLKAIKDAGYQQHTTVIVRFDPNEKGAPTRIFEINRERKREGPKTKIGDGPDPYVRNLIEDEVDLANAPGAAAKKIAAEKDKPDTMPANEALSTFLSFCGENYPAKHYMLFLVGHGMIVGNDAFLPDDRPDTAITLAEFGKLLRDFAAEINKGHAGVLELVGLHSCSMSAIEVAYQLKGAASFMMASEGISFVGSWPYRQLLKKVFSTVDQAQASGATVDVRTLVKRLHYLCLYNSTDFMFAGFSADLCVCHLRPANFDGLRGALDELVRVLRAGLLVEDVKAFILLAHLKAQSYWQESYTDLYDFCRCLSEQCNEKEKLQKRLKAACDGVMKQLDPAGDEQTANKLVVYSDYFGPTYQYSHGLSIYFPWSRPVEDGLENVMDRYKKYAFTVELENPWASFLEEYFRETKRHTRAEEDRPAREKAASGGMTPPQPRAKENGDAKQKPQEIFTGAIDVNVIGAVSALEGKPTAAMAGKTNPADSGGGICSCASIKNYPREFSISRIPDKPPEQ
jgi:hypothetical protein